MAAALLLGLALGAGSVAAAAEAPAWCAPGKPYLSGMHELKMQLAGLTRRALLYVPPGYRADVGLPLIVVPQAFGWSAEFNIQHSKLMPMAIRRNLSLVQLDAPGLAVNVALDGRANPARPDDVAYTTAVLTEVDRVLCLDVRRIYCVGFSRGARFCSRLASERSDIFAAISALSGVRYPRPNNATRPVPVLAFHGTADTVNPYPGGGPPYWQSSVDDAVSGWVDFNRCGRHSSRRVGTRQRVDVYSGCREQAEVVFTRTEGGGHEWPDAQYPLSAYPSEAPEANEIIVDFLMNHPLPIEINERPTEQAPAASSVTASPLDMAWAPPRPKGVGENVGPAGADTRKVIDTWDHLGRLRTSQASFWQIRVFRHMLGPVATFSFLAVGLLVARAALWRGEARCLGAGRGEAAPGRAGGAGAAAGGGGAAGGAPAAESSHLLC